MSTLAARGLSFPYLASGPADGRQVLLLHGFPQYSLEYAATLEALGAAGYRAVAPDQRGYAPGNRPADVAAYTMDELVDDVLGMLDALGWPRVDLVGHDWGGAVAWHVAGRHPERVRTLTALSTPHPLAMTKAMSGGGSQREKSGYIKVFRQEGVAEDALLGSDSAALRRLLGALPEAESYVARLSDRATLTAALNWYRTMSPEDGVKTGVVRVPTLYVWGTDDVAFAREAAEAAGEFVEAPYTFAPLPGADHWLPETQSAEVNSLLLAHLGEYAD